MAGHLGGALSILIGLEISWNWVPQYAQARERALVTRQRCQGSRSQESTQYLVGVECEVAVMCGN